MDKSNKQNVRYYFVDEAGDGTLFDRKGRVIIGSEGCSSFFISGLLDILDPVSLETDMKALREKFLNDPYFEGVPSMKPEAKKTSLAFHAKDDLPEVRRDVFSLLMGKNRDVRAEIAWRRGEGHPMLPACQPEVLHKG